ncbi:prefoldin subunit 6-like [Rhopilema esculentum]|uniref:prefoldin subunit 6-like n=1 Tax=Rhopilema esculentum TaxID=499914 RepID=UPI0031DE817A|eukprot:gene10655-19395_t
MAGQEKVVQQQLQKEVEEFQKLQKDMQKLFAQRQQLETQLTENKIVKEELDLIKQDANVFKLVGPVLVKQDLNEAKLNVEKRIEYIQAESKRHEKSLQDLEAKQTSHREGIGKLQQQYQQLMVKAQQK